MHVSQDAPEIRTLAQLRADIPVAQDFVYLNSCTFGPVPLSVQRAMAEALEMENRQIIAVRGLPAGVEFYERVEGARRAVAALLGAREQDLAWTVNTTSASRLALLGIDWRAGDRLAISDVEHLSTRSAARGLAQSRGVATTVIPTGAGASYEPAHFIGQLDRLLTPDHRLLVLSHVSNIDGRRLPVEEAIRLAHGRGVQVLVDGAQSVGILPTDVAAMGADLYSGSVHKWCFGPPGIGFLIQSAALRQSHNPYAVPFQENDHQPADLANVTAASLLELGTPNYALRIGAGCSVETLQRIGLPVIEAHTRSLTAQLRQGLSDLPGLRVVSPTAWENSSSVTTFQLEGGNPARCQQLVASLLEQHRIVVKFRSEVCGIRVGIAAFNIAAEIEQFLFALAQLLPLLR